ncbi:hypothetical protein M885DRAFT_523498 [Pelagophyceae sp. CCMP2097]|nr:hypothetical protein M885DRAFT_523498 [Pelagophyceae sp. CCMP2097]
MARPGWKCAVEFDGPWHYLTLLDGSRQRSGSSGFKDSLLRKLGWRVVHVPYYEWDGLSADHDAQDAYMRAKMQRLMMPVP